MPCSEQAAAADAPARHCGLRLSARGHDAFGHDGLGRIAAQRGVSSCAAISQAALRIGDLLLAQTPTWMLAWRGTSSLTAPIGAVDRHHAWSVSAARLGAMEARLLPAEWTLGASSVESRGRARIEPRWRYLSESRVKLHRIPFISRTMDLKNMVSAPRA